MKKKDARRYLTLFLADMIQGKRIDIKSLLTDPESGKLSMIETQRLVNALEAIGRGEAAYYIWRVVEGIES